MADLEQQFEQAAKSVAELTKRPDDQELLELYGLYKQGTVGDNNNAKPGVFQLKEKAKHEVWLKKKGMSQSDAKTQYVELVKKLTEKYGS